MSNFKTLIFDFDGTLADTVQVYWQAFNNIADRFALPKVKRSDIQIIRNTDLKTLCQQHHISLVQMPKIARALNQEVGKLITQVQFFPKIKETLLILKENYDLALLTSNNSTNIETFFNKENLLLNELFIFTHCEKQIFGKAGALRKLIKKHQLNRQEILYFGDQVKDIVACQKVGVKIAAVSWGFASEELLIKAKPDFLLNEVGELLSFFSF